MTTLWVSWGRVGVVVVCDKGSTADSVVDESFVNYLCVSTLRSVEVMSVWYRWAIWS